MYVGKLENISSVSYTHEGGSIPFPPSFTEKNAVGWRWSDVYDSPIDVNAVLDKSCFIGAITATVTEESLTKIEAVVDGVICGTYAAGAAGYIGGTITVPVGTNGVRVTLRLHTALRDVQLSSLEILGAYDDGKPVVWPTPKSIEYGDGHTKIKDVISENGDPDELFAASFLKERLAETTGRELAANGSVIVFEKADAAEYPHERYTVRTTDGKVTVKAASRLALLYGADTVLQLTSVKKGVRRFNCDDRPTKEFRGFHAGIPSRCQFDFMKRFFRYVLLPLRYNTVFVQLSGAVRYDSHPEIAEAWQKTVDGYRKGLLPKPPHYDMLANGEILEKDEVREYVGYARELGFEIIPEVQSLGHVQYVTLAHPELAEIDETEVTVKDTRAEDARPDTVYHHCYCPSLEESYKLIFDIIDETVELLKPERYVHIGHDEIYQIGVCKRCRTKDPADIYAEHVTRLHDHLAQKGLGTVIWSDMLQPKAYPHTCKAAEKLPRDVLMLDFIWYFNFGEDIEDNLLSYGYTVGAGNLYSSHYPRYKSRISKDGVIGGEISTWIANDEETYGNNGKLWDMAYLSEMLWNTENYEERNRRTYTEIIAKKVQPKLRDGVRGKFAPNGYKTAKIKLPKGAAAPSDVAAICPKAITLNGEKIEIGAKYDRLVFEHATAHSAPRIIWVPFEKIGDYVIEYSDGTRVAAPVKYAENIMAYNTTYASPMPQQFYRHNGYVGTWFADPVYRGKTGDGSDVTVTGFVWENPHPEKCISSVEYLPVENDYCGLILAGIKGLNKI